MASVDDLLKDIRACNICSGSLPLGPRPVLQFQPSAKILIAGQAPGIKVHNTGVPFSDASGKRLREWLGMKPEQFYDASLVSILPMGFCYPGTGKSGDFPPRPECAEKWRGRLMQQYENLELILVIGQYAQNYHFKSSKNNLTELVQSWQEYWPSKVPLPHPSPRNNGWLKRNPWFESEVVPALQKQVALVLATAIGH